MQRWVFYHSISPDKSLRPRKTKIEGDWLNINEALARPYCTSLSIFSWELSISWNIRWNMVSYNPHLKLVYSFSELVKSSSIAFKLPKIWESRWDHSICRYLISHWVRKGREIICNLKSWESCSINFEVWCSLGVYFSSMKK